MVCVRLGWVLVDLELCFEGRLKDGGEVETCALGFFVEPRGDGDVLSYGAHLIPAAVFIKVYVYEGDNIGGGMFYFIERGGGGEILIFLFLKAAAHTDGIPCHFHGFGNRFSLGIDIKVGNIDNVKLLSFGDDDGVSVFHCFFSFI